MFYFNDYNTLRKRFPTFSLHTLTMFEHMPFQLLLNLRLWFFHWQKAAFGLLKGNCLSLPMLSYFSCLPHIIFPFSSSPFSSFFLKKKKKKREKESWKFSTNQMCFAKPITSSNLNGLSVFVESQVFFLPWKPTITSQLKEERDQDIWLSCSFFDFSKQSKLKKKVVGEGGLLKIS